MKLTLGALFDNPDFHLFALEAERALFLRMDRNAYHRSIFVDGRVKPVDPAPIAVPLGPLLSHAMTQPDVPSIGWIFHVAQCGSTLLARALDRTNANLVLREPMPLRQLGVERANGRGGNGAWSVRLALATRMASRRYRSDLPTIVKANVPVNFMLDAIARADPSAPAIFLYFRFNAYLQAILRSDGHRNWVRRVTGELGSALGPEESGIASLGDGERAALLWMAQIARFQAAMSLMPNSVSLDADTLFAEPRAVVGAAAERFGAAMSAAEIDRIVGGDLFATYSKNPAIKFDNEARLERQAEVARSLAGEIDGARRWADAQGSMQRVPQALVRPLLGKSQPLFSA